MRLKLGVCGLLACVAALVACSGAGDSELRETANRFFDAVKQNDYKRAHRFLAEPLAGQQSAESLGEFVRLAGLDNDEGRSWSASSTNGDHRILEGAIRMHQGDRDIPIRLNFRRENLHWKIVGIERGVEIADGGETKTLFAPSLEHSALLARQTTAAFSEAVKRDQLAGFWEGTAAAFRQQYSSAQFASAFSGFVTDRVNLAPAAKLTPNFSRPPTVTLEGELVLTGSFPTRPSQVAFEYRYVQQDKTWRTSGLAINLVPLE